MQLELGTRRATRPVAIDDGQPRVTYVNVPDPYVDYTGNDCYDVAEDLDVDAARQHISSTFDPYGDQSRIGITRFAEHFGQKHESFQVIAHPQGIWNEVSQDKTPLWVSASSVDNPEAAARLEKQLSEFWQVPAGRPDDIWDSYHTRYGGPGLGPWAQPVEALLTNNGRTLWGQLLGGGVVGFQGKGTAAAGTTFTTDKTLVTNAWAGYRVYAADTTTNQVVFGNIQSNNNTGSASVLTIDQWYTPATPGGAAGTTPVAGFQYCVADGGVPSAWFMAIGTGGNTPAVTDTQISTNGNAESTVSGMVRKLATYALVQGTSPASYTISTTFTLGTNTTVTGTQIGLFNSIVRTATVMSMMFSTGLNANFTVSQTNDAVTISDTITGS